MNIQQAYEAELQEQQRQQMERLAAVSRENAAATTQNKTAEVRP